MINENSIDAAVRERLDSRIAGFLWQHLLLACSLYLMTLGVTLCLRSDLGTGVISTIPYVMTLAGRQSLVPDWTVGQYTYCMNFILVALQIIVLRRKFELVQLFQLLIGFAFGFLLDINMWLTSNLCPANLLSQGLLQVLGCLVLALGIAFEIRCGSVTMPGEGLPVAISSVLCKSFATIKIFVDITLVAIAVILGFLFFGAWPWHVVGVGTLFAMIFVGSIVKLINPHLRWFDRLLNYRPGFHRYLYGLARLLYRHN